MNMSNPSASNPSALIITEQINPRTVDIDLLSTTEVLEKINDEDQQVANAVKQAIPQISRVVDYIVQAFEQGGHLFYFGAGTSGRLGVLDASECPPTYGAPPEQVQGYIAGGDSALRTAVEGAEDSEELGREDLEKAHPRSGDVVVGLSASGRAAYVVGALKAAKAKGCFTACVTCHQQSPLIPWVDQPIVVEVGPEVIAGSTRMKAGTAQKLVLNMLTTAAMIQTGKTYENFMVDVQPTNQKLKERARRIVAALGQVSEDAAQEALEITQGQVKPAILMLRKSLSYSEAMARLKHVSGKLRLALKEPSEGL